MRTCKHCGCTEFYSSGNCKKCTSEWHARRRAEKRDELNRKTQEWRDRYPEKIREYTKVYTDANREEIRSKKIERRRLPEQKLKTREYNLSYNAKNADRLRTYRSKYADRQKQLAKVWRQKNPERGRVQKQNRRSRVLANGGKLSPDIVQRLMRLQRGKCACCGKSLSKGYHLDHIVPIALGGTNTDYNVQLLTPRCNLEKSKKTPERFMRERGLLL